jgi:hypothetical protein
MRLDPTNAGSSMALVVDWLERLDVLAEHAADGAERTVQAAGKRAHSSRRRERYQGQNQKVLNQALTSLIFVQPGDRIQNESHH